MTTAVEFLWRAAGCPTPTDTEGNEIRRRNMQGARCAATNLPADYHLDDAVSEKFTTLKNGGRAWPFGGPALSASAVWCTRTLALRCAMFFAREDGIWFEAMRPLPGVECRRRMDALATLLNPPEPPFVAGLPLYGIDHGGEANIERTVWWESSETGAKILLPRGPWVRREDASKPLGPTRIVDKPLIKLQSKHTALFCRVSTRADVYPLQVDDSNDIVVDVAEWSRLRVIAEDVMAELRLAGVGANAVRAALQTGREPAGAPLSILAKWPATARHFARVVGSTWWPIFVQLLPMPELTPTPKAPARAKNQGQRMVNV